MHHTPCPICREEHAPNRGLSYDGKGINSCGMYRNRIATFKDHDIAEELGPKFAAAPAMYEALKGLFEHCAMIHKHWGDGSNAKEAKTAIDKALEAIAQAEGK